MRFWLGIFGLGAGLNILLGLHGWPAVLHGQLNDPDSYMRLERILQGIHAGHLTNMVARDGPGAGVMVEWSRLLDALIWALALPFAPFVGWPVGLVIAGDMLGPLGIGALSVALAFVAEPFAARPFLFLSAVGAALMPGVRVFAGPGVVHYHIMLLAMIMFTVGFIARAWQGDRWYGFWAGICGGLAIWLTPETMPFILLAFGALMIQWAFVPIGDVIAACAAGFADPLIFGLAIDPPVGGYGVIEIDRLSVVYVALALLLMIGGLWLWRLDHMPRPRHRRTLGFALMAALVSVWTIAFPNVVMGPYGIVPPSVYRKFFGVMLELQPLQGLGQLFPFLMPGCLAFGFCLLRAWCSDRIKLRLVWLYGAGVTLLCLVLADRFILFVGFAAIIAAALTPVIMNDISARLAATPTKAVAARMSFVLVMFAVPMVPVFWVGKTAVAVSNTAQSCNLRDIGNIVVVADNATVIAPAEDAPELLFRTHINVVGSLYQHGVPGYLRLRDAWRARAGASEPAAVATTGATYILFCSGEGRTPLVADLPSDTLWDVLAANHPPPWLSVAATDPLSGWILYKISQ